MSRPVDRIGVRSRSEQITSALIHIYKPAAAFSKELVEHIESILVGQISAYANLVSFDPVNSGSDQNFPGLFFLTGSNRLGKGDDR